MKVFLGDVRPTPDGWVRAYTREEVIELLGSGEVEAVSFDFDLGFRGEVEHRTGEVVLLWIEVGRQRLQRALDAINRRLRETA